MPDDAMKWRATLVAAGFAGGMAGMSMYAFVPWWIALGFGLAIMVLVWSVVLA